MAEEGFLQKFINKTFFWGLGAIFIGFVGFIGFLIFKVISGEGLEYYFTGFGKQFSYLGALILIGLIPVCILCAFLVSWWLSKDERDFLRKYGKSNNDNNT